MTVSCLDATGAEHAVEVTARSLYEAVARGLHVLRERDWVEEIHQDSTITIALKSPRLSIGFESETSKTGSLRVEVSC